MGNPYGDDHIENIDDFDELTPEEQQLENDIDEEMAKQGVTHEDFKGDVPFGAFVNIDRT